MAERSPEKPVSRKRSTASARQQTLETQVQDIAVKAIEGSSASKSLANLQQILAEQSRRPAQEK